MKFNVKNLITFFIILPIAVSCTPKSVQSNETISPMEIIDDTAETQDTYIDTFPDKFSETFTFSMAHIDPSTTAWTELKLSGNDEATGDILDDAIYERNMYIEERFNCVLNIENLSGTSGLLQNLVLAGDSTYDIFGVLERQTPLLAAYINSFDFLPYVDLSAPWWDSMVSDTYSISGKILTASGSFSLSVPSKASVYVFNKTLYNTYNDEDIYDIVRGGKWTVDKFYETASNAVFDIDGNGEFDANDRYGIMGTIKNQYGLMVSGSGIKYVERDSDGIPQFTLPDNESAISKLVHILELNIGNNIYYPTGMVGSREEAEATYFRNNQTIYIIGYIHMLSLLRDCEFEVGILPLPKYDENQDHYHSSVFAAETVTVPMTLSDERAENVGLILEGMAKYSYYNLMPVYKETVLAIKFARDEDVPDMLDIVFATTYMDLADADGATFFNPLIQNVYETRENRIVSTLESMRDSAKALIDKWIANANS